MKIIHTPRLRGVERLCADGPSLEIYVCIEKFPKRDEKILYTRDSRLNYENTVNSKNLSIVVL